MAEDRQERGRGRQLFCRIITPERAVYDGEADLVVVRIADGDLGVMADHAPTVSKVEIGDVRIREGEERRVFATSDGFFKVSDNLVQVLVEEAVPAEEIDADEAGTRVEEAERELGQISGEEGDERRRAELERRQKIGENLSRVARRYGEG